MPMRAIRLLSVVVMIFVCAGVVSAKNANGSSLLVDNDRAQCPTAAFTKIQDAVNAASAGTRIEICAGVYNEQVVINKNLELSGQNAAIIMPSGMVANTTSLASGSPIAAAVLVTSAS